MTATETTEQIEAAGCVVWRLSKKGNLKVLLIHRPQYDDWSFPKGKVDEGESFLEAALREVKEEVNVTGQLGPELAPTHYIDSRGRPKVVRYWALWYLDGVFEPNDEVDKVKWMKLEKAALKLSYAHDLVLLSNLRDALE